VSGDELTRFGVGLLQLLDEAATNSSYKYALLVALVDLATESVGRSRGPRGSVTTEQIARRVIALYWPQARPYPGLVRDVEPARLRALQTPGSSVVDAIVQAQGSIPGRRGAARITPDELERRAPEAWADLLDFVEERFIRFPIPLLQRMGRGAVDLIYATDRWPEKGTGLPIRRYLRARRAGAPAKTFDNRIVFVPGAEESLARLAPLLRPLVMERWARWTEERSGLAGEGSVFDFLFGGDRIALGPVRDDLARLQGRRCFYCRAPLAAAVDVDHFVPWSRAGCDDLFNLVAAHRGCNNDKRDHLAAARHVDAWLERLDARGDDLRGIAAERRWAADAAYARDSARSTYWVAGEGRALLWSERGGDLEPFRPGILARLRSAG